MVISYSSSRRILIYCLMNIWNGNICEKCMAHNRHWTNDGCWIILERCQWLQRPHASQRIGRHLVLLCSSCLLPPAASMPPTMYQTLIHRYLPLSILSQITAPETVQITKWAGKRGTINSAAAEIQRWAEPGPKYHKPKSVLHPQS